ncbi:MAG TPA: branched-chain amino acid ABC transporter substrate-binding protein, partial [Rhizobiaceae bacterium]|nr:branched-chain amino acid ABC transporter substrate-binding protein [Rhizobiaceae bacterium]
MPNTLAAVLYLFLLSVNASLSFAQDANQSAPAAPSGVTPIEVKIGYLRAYAPELALSVLDIPPPNEGVAGAEVAIADNNTTGSFLGQKFTLDVTTVEPRSDVTGAFREMAEKGVRYILADISAEQLLSIADLARDEGVLIFNVGAHDDI